ncbi:TonB-dependent receptor [Flavisphingomonas formosensis]|uniref:TonB-dependent receptor n=1 Tax=Flavisphingomonas formosensis TaxID=861534 RepID=UPI001E3D012C|nr:TonB-dependent receptor [Sphingomonas formosensis]
MNISSYPTLAMLLVLGGGMAAAPAFAEDAAAGDDTIVVTGQRAQQERSIEAKRVAIGVLDVSAADEIGRLPDRNVAEVVERLPGVGVTYDQGEGRYVAIRGVPSTLNGYTINGFELGAPDGQTRSVPLDIISGQLLNRVEVAKVKTADQDGQGIGGTINLVTQTAFDFKQPFALTVNAQAGYQDLKQNKVPIRGDVSIAKRFGADEQFGIVLGGSYSDRTYTSYGFYPDDWRPLPGFARGGAPTNIKYTNYTLERERIGASGSFDWRPNDRHQFYVRGIYSKFTEHEIRPRYRLDFATDAIVNAGNLTLNNDGLTGTSTGTQNRFDLRLDDKSKSTLMAMAGGKSRFGDLTLDYGAARVHNRVTDEYPLWQFRCNPGTVDFDFSNTLYTATPRTPCTASKVKFNQYSYFNQRGTENIWQGRIDATWKLNGIGTDSVLRFGAKYRDSGRRFDQDNDVWGAGSSALTLDQFGLQGKDYIVSPSDGSRYLNGPTIDPAAIQAFTQQYLNSAYFKKNVATSLANDTLSDFDLHEKVSAAYGEANLDFGAVSLTAGLRYEYTRLNVQGFQLQDGTMIVPVRSRTHYGNVLPSLIVKIAPSDDTIFRLAYTRSLGRPEYSDLSPGGSLSTADDTLSLGNPGLKPYISDNLDATAEWYFAKGGLLSVGVFAKFIKNPIFSRTTILTDTNYNGEHFDTLEVTQPFNAKKGDIVGIEAQYQQQFTFLPGLLSGFGISLTGTLTNSTLKLTDGRTSTFPSQSKYLYGAELFYQKGPFEASIAYHNTGKALLAVGDVWYNDQYNNDLRRLDAKASVAVWKDMRVFFEAQNLTDEPTRQYQGGNTNWIIQTERYGRTFYGGVSAKF